MAMLIMLPALVLAQSGEGDAVKALIKKLGSSSFQERQAATKALQERPEAAPAVRDALRSADSEIRNRAGEILDYYDRRPVRDLDAAVKEGRVHSVIEMLAGWPTGKYDQEAWYALHDFATTLTALHKKQGGEKIKLLMARDQPVLVLSAKRITEATVGQHERAYFLLAGEVDLDDRRRKPGEAAKNAFAHNAVIVAAGSVRILPGHRHIIVADGSVVLQDSGGPITDTLIVSCGDVTLHCGVANSLIIARGKVISTGELAGNRIISGKSVTRTSKSENIITENEPNPLGFIRWTEPSKEKASPKSK